MTAPLMPRATAVWLVENTTLTFRQISVFCELHELEIQAIADGDVSGNIRGLSPIDNGQLTLEEIRRCEADNKANLQMNEMERNVKVRNLKAKKVLSPSQRQDKPNAIAGNTTFARGIKSFNFSLRLVRLLNRNTNASTVDSACDKTVAKAAPLTPNPNTLMNMGSNTTLVTAPARTTIILCKELPCAVIK